MKFSTIIKAQPYNSTNSEVYINKSILEIGMTIINLYDKFDYEYTITKIDNTFIYVKLINKITNKSPS